VAGGALRRRAPFAFGSPSPRPRENARGQQRPRPAIRGNISIHRVTPSLKGLLLLCARRETPRFGRVRVGDPVGLLPLHLLHDRPPTSPSSRSDRGRSRPWHTPHFSSKRAFPSATASAGRGSRRRGCRGAAGAAAWGVPAWRAMAKVRTAERGHTTPGANAHFRLPLDGIEYAYIIPARGLNVFVCPYTPCLARWNSRPVPLSGRS